MPQEQDPDPANIIWRAAMGLQHMIPVSDFIEELHMVLKVAIVGANIEVIDRLMARYEVSFA